MHGKIQINQKIQNLYKCYRIWFKINKKKKDGFKVNNMNIIFVTIINILNKKNRRKSIWNIYFQTFSDAI